MDERIQLEVWTGALYAPILRKQLDAAQLNSTQQAEFHRLVEESNLASQPAELPASPIRDGSHVKLVMSSGDSTQTVRISTASITPAIERLVDFIKQHGL